MTYPTQRDQQIRLIGRDIDRWTQRLEERLLGIIAARRGGYTGVMGSVDVVLLGTLQTGADALEKGLRRLFNTVWDASTRRLLRSVPLEYWVRRFAPINLLAMAEATTGGNTGLLEYTGGIEAQNEWERILNGQATRTETMEIIRRSEFGQLRPEQVDAVLDKTAASDGLSAMQRIKTVGQGDIHQLRSIIRAGMSAQDITGASAIESMARQIRPLVGNDPGQETGMNYRAKRIARTEGVRVAEEAQHMAWDGVKDMLKGKRVWSSRDANVRAEHRIYNTGPLFVRGSDGRYRHPMLGEFHPPPFAPNCRCYTEVELRDELTAGAPGADYGAYDQGMARFRRQKKRMVQKGRRVKPKVKPREKPIVRPAPTEPVAVQPRAARPVVEPKPRKKPIKRPVVKPKVKAPAKRPEPLNRVELERRVSRGENSIADGSRETALVYDSQGKVLLRKTGAKDAVDFTREDIRKMKGRVLTHNHPSVTSKAGVVAENFPPSGADGAFLAANELGEMRAVTSGYRYSLRLKTGAEIPNVRLHGKRIHQTWERRLRHLERKELKKLAGRVAKREISRDELARIMHTSYPKHQHQAWLDVADELQLDYTRVAR